ncbi:hypothetical protein AB6D06_07230 [Vibrio sp. 10N.239.311.G01]|uniref:hypothetical protein n=1 Tax=Vibrio sp. 10N.239.311.G01 TaxID=3229976 RepID=UPI00354ED436
MNTTQLYKRDFPEEHKVQLIDIITLYHEERFDELDTVIICKDEDGNVTATFGQSDWNCFPFSRKKERNSLSFKEFSANMEIQRELKLITLGWLLHNSPKMRKALNFSGIHSRLRAFKRVYRFLAENRKTSLKALSLPDIWDNFEIYLQQHKYSQSTLMHTFSAINAAIDYASWHRLNLELKPIKSSSVAKRLNNLEKQQILVIPERLCNSIYSKAIELIDYAYPHIQLISNTENALQSNYLQGKRIIDAKVKNGRKKYYFINEDGSINNHKYSEAVQGNQPLTAKEIIEPLAQTLPDIPLENGNDFKRYLGQLTNAAYIICGGFSGMRDSELDKLTPNSYYHDTFEGRDYHMLQSHTFKLGEKRETWVTAPSSKKAIGLMDTLTERWRKEIEYPDDKYNNTLWVSQTYRSRPPILILDWNERLKRFCKQFGFIVTSEDYQECITSNPNSIERVKKYVKVGQPWYITTHQFRRTLAFYCIKNRLSTVVALKQQFKHIHLAMTEWYTNGGKLAGLRDLKVDTKIQQALEEINAETTANKIFKQWHSDETLSGAHGKAIMKMRGDVPTIYSSWDVIYKAVKDGKLTLHGSMHSYCKSGYDCDMDGVVAPQFCVDCGSGSSIIDEQQAKWWQKKHRSLVAYMESGEDISVSEHSHYVTQVRAAEKVMADFDMSFTPFEPDLKVANI